jgi:hypothetical protein
MRRATPPVVAIGRVERRQIDLADRVEHEPREVVIRQPLTQTRRQQQLLLAITPDEVPRHHQMVLNPPDATGFVRHPPRIAIAPQRARRSSPTRRKQRRGPRLRRTTTRVTRRLQSRSQGTLPRGLRLDGRMGLSFDAAAVAFRRHADLNAECLVLAEHQDGSGMRLEIQRAVDDGSAPSSDQRRSGGGGRCAEL